MFQPQPWAEAVLAGLSREFPAVTGHMSTGPGDCDVTPSRLHPAFWGCLDWHSAVHMMWSGLVLAAHPGVDESTKVQLQRVISGRLSAENIAVEADYLRRHPGFERPYGWAWLFQLAAQCTTTAATAPLAARLEPLLDTVEASLVDWLPRLSYPVRYGLHTNTAFGLALITDSARELGRPDVLEEVTRCARRWFLADRNYPVGWEPSGTDFLSGGLCEALLMKRVLTKPEFGEWLLEFLPGLGLAGDPLLNVPAARDRTDGTLVHLFGLMLSRAWMLGELAPAVEPERRERIYACIPRLIGAAEAEIVEGDFMSTHWLVTFALKAHQSAARET
ncbi:DUF2891 family protein [Corynebacterium phocae]|nr:DUF2891 family protein [Corynebacterium phocae]KAA8721956.1 DUF2891 family protein [Corynebacterium phocae]